MPTDLKINAERFVAASRTWAASHVEKANTNGNPYLTKAEAKALPADLQDNFAAYRGRQWSRVGTAKGFVEDFTRKVADAAKRADMNGDGFIDEREMHLLPKDLRDNFANFARIAPPAAPEKLDDVALPLSPENLAKVREAFVNYVERDLTVRRPEMWDGGFEYENRDWGMLVREFGGDGKHDALKAEMLKLARTWTPDKRGWDLSEWQRGGNPALEYSGHFKFMTVFVSLQKGQAPAFMTEID